MLRYQTRIIDLRIGEFDYRIRALKDRQQYYDPDEEAERAGVPPAMWAIFGQLWPTGVHLASEIAKRDIHGKRILEIGCGLALSSLVLQRGGADVTATDQHPLAERFLHHNAGLNHLIKVPYVHLDWRDDLDATLGKFDIIVGSDVLYERNHATLLSNVVGLYAADAAEVLIADPGRGNCGAWTTAMLANGFTSTESRFSVEGRPVHSGRLMKLQR
ncbi:class I SAM-dependent methyltransferase [Lysobacter sp. CA199]|uniref:class I SAM-dependent methyltransferase n=1 Tax=Lysobacter sp. CA199 TaxID=3455608 RepID=UPI003F8D7EEC